MISFIGRRLGVGLFTIWFISVLSFLLIELPPGDYVSQYVDQIMLEGGRAPSPERIEFMRHEYGLDQPLVVQYGKWLGRVVTGDYGISLAQKRPVAAIIGENLGLTVVLGLLSLLFSELVALPVGILAALRQYSKADYFASIVGFIGLGIPDFLISLVLLYGVFLVFHINISGLFSAGFQDAPWSLAKVGDLLVHLPLPIVVIGLLGTAAEVRILRANLLDELRKPYVVTALAKGLPEWRATVKYPIRVALNPFVSGIGFILPSIVSGSVIVSVVLGLPTLGPILFHALQQQDMFLAATIVLLLGVLTVIGTLISDLVLMWLEPRVRAEG